MLSLLVHQYCGEIDVDWIDLIDIGRFVAYSTQHILSKFHFAGLWCINKFVVLHSELNWGLI